MIIYEEEINDYSPHLQHYGRKGMKWGQNIFSVKDGKIDFSSGGGGGAAEEEEDEKKDEPGNEFANLWSKAKSGGTMVNPLLNELDSGRGGGFSSKTNTKQKKKGKNFVSKVINGIKKLNKITVNGDKHELGTDKYQKYLPKKKTKSTAKYYNKK